jgi:alpha-L-rhamnosidase
MLFAVTLLDYVKASGDIECGKELFPIAAKQFSFFAKNFTQNLRYTIPERNMSDGGEGWHFVDCESVLRDTLFSICLTLNLVGQPTLDKESSEHAIMIYCLKATQELAELLNLDAPAFILPDSTSSVPVTTIIEKLTNAHRQHYFDANRGVFVSGQDKQVSWAANAWAVLAGVPESKEAAAKAMQVTYEMEGAIMGMTPYLHHYVSWPAVLLGTHYCLPADIPPCCDSSAKHSSQ